MTITNTQVVVSYLGNGVTTNFPFNFLIPTAEDVVVILRDLDTNATEVVDPSQYTVNGAGNPAGGSIDYGIGNPLPSTKRLYIVRAVPYEQELDITNQDGFYPDTLEQQLDLIVMQIQQLAEALNRAVTMDYGEAGVVLQRAAQRLDTVFTFDETGAAKLVPRADFQVGPQGPPGVTFKSTWQDATTYAVDDLVTNNGSTYICILAHTGIAAFTEPGVGSLWQTYWEVFAEKGASGAGTGDVVGPASAVNNRFASFDGTSGKLIKDSLYNPASFVAFNRAIAVGSGLLVSNGGVLGPQNVSDVTISLDKATASEAAASTSDVVLTADVLASAAALDTLVDDTTIAWSWADAFNSEVTIAGNRVLGNPTDAVPGQYRSIIVKGNDATPRALTFDTEFGGDLPSLSDITSSKWYLLTIRCIAAGHFIVSATDASPPT